MKPFRKHNIFLDFAAGHNNPSALYEEGIQAKRALDDARSKIAHTLHVQARDIIFTSGGTESDNLALLGTFEVHREKHPHIVISSIEHPAVREAAQEAKRRGAILTIIEAEDGVINSQKVLQAITPATVLVSIMYVNNETGAIQPISHIARLIKEYRKKHATTLPYLHTDASQATTILDLDVSKLGVDLMTLDASKVNGPKGVGLLMVRPNVEIKPIIFGGGQERGMRGGTENISGITQFAEALEDAQARSHKEFERLSKIKKVFLEELSKSAPQAIINSPTESAPHIVSISFPNILHEFLAVKLAERGVFVSTGSSCKHIGSNESEALRFSFGRETTEREVRQAVRILAEELI